LSQSLDHNVGRVSSTTVFVACRLVRGIHSLEQLYV